MDIRRPSRETLFVPLRPGLVRHRLANVLNAAYGDGLLSERTLAHRLDLLFGSPVIEPGKLVGDLTLRAPERSVPMGIARALGSARKLVRGLRRDQPAWQTLLALDWTGGQEDLLVGRRADCDIVLTDPSVSRRHARLRFRDGHWILHDLESTNGTLVNDVPVVRCELRAGDLVALGDEHLVVD
jgi:hypothetical protein